ncbi:hypothetical protein FOYG_14083 [Fusarium oxysporum NRRL 32931]|uniref:Zn(2)-C6 fungal-type domain-containing protein n=1 Tax=Fusarium oxysporum NRRL 32931 TaxID=660029 RepID=W9HVT3_FUSOX|nr:hypothetical protein FOYG_14083 [Fusarium oxysporum NRRL 32931]
MIPKACEPCRRRKIKCNGQTACNGCQKDPAACIYRVKARTRTRRSIPKPSTSAERVNSVRSPIEAIESLQSPTAEAEVANSALCYDVAAVHHSPQHTDSSGLFYGPACSFAFLQHIHRAILSNVASDMAGDSHENNGLDDFMIRNVFFGIPPRISLQTIPTRNRMDEIISSPDAVKLLDIFKNFSLHVFPFLTPAGLDGLLSKAYGSTSFTSHSSQDKALLLIILAIGTLSTANTNEAERLFQHAQRQAEVYIDAVTIPMIQFSLLVTDYQLNMGRPSAAYLQISSACRKAYALGLHRFSIPVALTDHGTQDCRATLWTVYSYDSWISFSLGRPNNMRRADLGCAYPENQFLLLDQCHIATGMEDASIKIYSKQFTSLLQLYETIEDLHNNLVQKCKQLGPKAIKSAWQASQAQVLGQVTLLNMYYNFVLTIYRPLLIAETALRSAGKADRVDMLWLQPACRKATAAAEDCIALLQQTKQIMDINLTRRQNAFYLETSCAILLYDSLSHPPKYQNNIQSVNMGLELLQMMVCDEPVSNAIQSVERIVIAVEHALSKGRGFHTLTVLPTHSERVQDTIHFERHDSLQRQHRASRDENLSSHIIDEVEPVEHHELFQCPEIDFDALTADLFASIPLDGSLLLSI